MEQKDILEKLSQIRKKREDEKNNKLDEVVKDDKIYIKFSASHKEFELEKFIQSFGDEVILEDIWIKDHLYIISVKSDQKELVKDINKIFSDYETYKKNEICKDFNIEQRYDDYPDAYCSSDFVRLNEKAEKIKSFHERNEYKESFKEQRENLLSLSDDDLNKKLINLVSELYGLEKGISEKLVKSVSLSVEDFFNKCPYMGQALLHSFQFPSADFTNFKNGKTPDQNDINKMQNNMVFQDVSSLFQKQQSIHYRKHDDFFLNNVLSKAKTDSVSGKLVLLELKSNDINEDDYDKHDKEMFKIIRKYKLPKTDTLISSNPFSFFNTYNIMEKDYSQERPIVKELLNIMFAKKIVVYQQELFKIIDRLMEGHNEGKLLSFEDVKREIDGLFEVNKPPKVELVIKNKL